MKVDLFEAEAVEGDDAAVTGAAHALQIGAVGAVAHGARQIEHQALEELGGRAADELEEIAGDAVAELSDRRFDALFGT